MSVRPDLADFVSNLPKKAGVYIMKNDEQKTIYIGKAKDLRARVRSYFNLSDSRYQVKFLVKKVASIETILTDTEEQALLLERDLINRFKPKYNVRLKDDKSYLSIRLDLNSSWPRLETVRRRKQNDSARYFGPYTQSNQLREILELIKQAVPLRTCNDTIFNNRARPCLEYQIKRCLGPCCIEVDKEEYENHVKEAIDILNGKTTDLKKQLEIKMERAAEKLDFENAAAYRDRVDFLNQFSAGQKYVSNNTDDRDVFALYRDHSLATLAILQVRNGRINYNKNYSFDFLEFSNEVIMQSLLEDYYQSASEIPDEIVVNYMPEDPDVIQQYLKGKTGRRPDIVLPQKALKFRLLKLAELNAERHFELKFLNDDNLAKILKELTSVCNLRQTPRRIECIDISNIQGSDIVGAVVSYYDGKPDKSRYRKYKISFSGTVPNDFAAIAEVVLRHLKRASEAADFPDLLIIDGGKTQLDYAYEAMQSLNLNIDLIALAKDRVNSKTQRNIKKQERIYLVGEASPIPLAANNPMTKFIAGIRDEVHRFVITFHREQRAKRHSKSVLDQIPGVGIERRMKLLKAFGGVDEIAKARLEDIVEKGKVPVGVAERILKILGERKG